MPQLAKEQTIANASMAEMIFFISFTSLTFYYDRLMRKPLNKFYIYTIITKVNYCQYFLFNMASKYHFKQK